MERQGLVATTQFIRSNDSLVAFCQEVPESATLYLDTEFMRERTYFASLCLIQIRVGDTIALIDTVELDELQPLWDVVARSEVVLHSGRQDLEVIYNSAELLPDTLFDTQVAAGLCGQPAQMGYGNLVAEIAEVTLAKAHTRENWAKRPLAEAALEYAADDVRYLPEIHAKLSAQLVANDRLDWAKADSRDLLNPSLYAPQSDSAWKRLKGLGRIPAAAQHRAAHVAGWREKTALAKDLPRQWILKDAELLAVSMLEEPDQQQVADQIESAGNARRYQNKIVELLRSAPRKSDALLTDRRPEASEKALAKALAAIVAACAKELEIESEILAPMRELRQLAAGERNVRVLTGWRAPLLADALLERCNEED